MGPKGLIAACSIYLVSSVAVFAEWDVVEAENGSRIVFSGAAPEKLSVSCLGEARLVIFSSATALDAPVADQPNAHIVQFLFDKSPAVVAVATSRWAINDEVVESILSDPDADAALKESVSVRMYQVVFQSTQDEGRFFQLLKSDSRLSIGGDVDGTTQSIRTVSLAGSSAALSQGGC